MFWKTIYMGQRPDVSVIKAFPLSVAPYVGTIRPAGAMSTGASSRSHFMAPAMAHLISFEHGWHS
jgi:hypothetical protein